jgi:hypothetical protein
MILRRQGEGDEAYNLKVTRYTYVEKIDDVANKNSALIGSASPLGERIIYRILHCREFSPTWRKLPLKLVYTENEISQDGA